MGFKKNYINSVKKHVCILLVYSAITKESGRTRRVEISSINFAHFSNYNRYLVSVGRGMGGKMFVLQKFLS